jgi:hypothetical protein
VGGSATGAAAALAPAPRVVRRLAGLSAVAAAEAERRLRVELELAAAAALRVDMAGGETCLCCFASSALHRLR